MTGNNLRRENANGLTTAVDDSDDVEMEIEAEENDETVVYKDDSKAAAALDTCNIMLQQQDKRDGVSIQKMPEASEAMKREIKLKKMENDLESSIASQGMQR